MRSFRWLLLPAAQFWLTGYEAQSLDECLAETTVDCAIEQAVVAARKSANSLSAPRHTSISPACRPMPAGMPTRVRISAWRIY